MNAEELAHAWATLPVPDVSDHFEATMVTDGGEVWAALDYERNPTLLIAVPERTRPPSVETKGLSVSVGRHRVSGRDDSDYVVLQCQDDAFLGPLAAVGAEIALELVGVDEHDRSRKISEVLNRWRWFWDITRDRLSEHEALGLFAELWFLDQWLGVSPPAVASWTGSESSRHDFQWPSASVEVKATARRSDRGMVHRIQSLDQLADPETGSLYLFSMQVLQDRLAGNSLPILVDRCSDQLRGTGEARESFLRKVSRRGYSPAYRRLHETPYRILQQGLYEVDASFPRLTRESFTGGLPAGIVDVSYSLNMAACQNWHRAASADQWVFPTLAD